MREIVIFAVEIGDKMNEKEIRSFSLAKLLEVCGRREEDLWFDGCLVADRDAVKEEAAVDLFRYPTRIDAYAVAFCSKGSITVSSDLTRHVIGERMMYVHFPGSILQVVSEQESAVRIILCEEAFIRRINVDLKLFSQLFLSVRGHPCLPLGEEEWTELTRAFDDIHAEGLRGCEDAVSEEIRWMLLRTTAYRICRIIDGSAERRRADAACSVRNRNHEYFRAFMDALSRHYMQQRTVGFYAAQLHLTPKYLTTIIRRTSGRSAIEWIDEYVVLEAKNLLKYSTMSIQQIAYYLNFPNQSFFGKYFRNHTGMTPTAYRMGR